MKLRAYNQVTGLATHANLCGAATKWVFWANTWKNTCCGFLGIPFQIFVCFILQLARSLHKWTDFDDLYVIRRVSDPRMCLLGVSFILFSILGVKSPKDHILRAWIGISSLTCKINIHTIEITVPITTKFCTVIKTTKYSTWVVPTRVKQIQDGVRRHLEKLPYCRDSNSQPLIVSRTP